MSARPASQEVRSDHIDVVARHVARVGRGLRDTLLRIFRGSDFADNWWQLETQRRKHAKAYEDLDKSPATEEELRGRRRVSVSRIRATPVEVPEGASWLLLRGFHARKRGDAEEEEEEEEEEEKELQELARA